VKNVDVKKAGFNMKDKKRTKFSEFRIQAKYLVDDDEEGRRTKNLGGTTEDAEGLRKMGRHNCLFVFPLWTDRGRLCAEKLNLENP